MTHFQRELNRTGTEPNVSYFRMRSGGVDVLAVRPDRAVDGVRRLADVAPPSREPLSNIIISNAQSTSKLSLLVTATVIVVTAVAAGCLYHAAGGMQIESISDFLASGVLTALIFCGFLKLSSNRQPLKPSNIYDRAHEAFVAWMMSFGLLLAIAFAFKFGAELSRGAILSHFIFGLVAVPASHMHAPIWLARSRKSSAFKSRSIILIGARGAGQVAHLNMDLQRGGCRGPYLVEFSPDCSDAHWARELETLLNSVTQLTHRLGPGEIYLASAEIPPARVQTILRSLELIPRTIFVVPDSYTASLLRLPTNEIGNGIAVAVQQEPLSAAGRATKRAMDIVLSFAGLVFLAPLLAVIAFAIRWDSPGPVLFRQSRNGYQGQPFRILKFRTMTVMDDGDVIQQACRNDVRVTRLGRLLRMTSLDELPQLFNVLRGDMSLIGPRPHARAHDVKYAKVIENYEIRQHVKPGITGWAQVNGFRGETQTVELMRRRIELDLWYARNCGLLLDLRILARTVLEVLRPSNVY